MAFETVEELRQHFADAINSASSDAAVVELRSEQREAEAEFRLSQVLNRERNIWVRESFQKFPLARSFPQLITGDTEEEVEAAARSIHEQLEVAFDEHQRQKDMQKFYEQFLARSQNPANGGSDEPAV